jgi:Ca2+-transporting ATPase
MTKIISRGIMIAMFTLGCFSVLLREGMSIGQARTGAMLTLVFSQLIHVFECRSEDKGLFEISLKGGKYVVLAALSSAVCVWVCMVIPAFAEIFALVNLGIKGTVFSLAMASAVPLISGIAGKLRRRKVLPTKQKERAW